MRGGSRELLPRLDRLLVLPDTGHMAPLERHQEVVDVLSELAGIGSGPQAPGSGRDAHRAGAASA